MIYLDEAATSKPKPEILEAIRPYIEIWWMNPSSNYKIAEEVKNKIEEVRNIVASSIKVEPDEIFFTSGASESNNWVIRGFDDENINCESVIITTPIEHKSILNAVYNTALHSDVQFCKVDNYGFVDLNSLKNFLEFNKDKKILVSICGANNEIGTIQDIVEISKLVHEYGGILHSDMTQSYGHINNIEPKEIGIDLMSVSAQKIGALKGTGFLYKNKNVQIKPLIYGEQEREQRGGTENVIGIIALGEIVKKYIDDDYTKLVKSMSEVISKRRYMIDQLISCFGCKLNGHKIIRLPNNINVTFPQNITAEALIHMLEYSNIYISAGSACNSKSIEPSYVLKVIGLSDEEAMKTVRFTLPDDITYEQINKVIYEISKCIKLIESES